MLKRIMGKASFATIQDGSGQIEFYLSRDAVGEETYAAFKHWDIGDILGARGTLMKTKTGELTIQVTELRLLTKSLRPLPDKFHGMADQEMKYRQRYLDLITNPQSRDTFIKRSKIVRKVRDVMVSEGYLEVRNADDAPDPGRRSGQAFHHPP